MVLVKWVAPVMDLLWWCNQFQRLDFRIETIHHSLCQCKVYLHTAVAHRSLQIPRAEEDLLEEQSFCCFFFHCHWGQSLRSLHSYSSSTVSWCYARRCRGTHPRAIADMLKYPAGLLCHDSNTDFLISVFPLLHLISGSAETFSS